MKNRKVKGLMIATAILASPLLASTHAFAATSSFTDINSSDAKDSILKLQNMGILNGNSNSKFNPNGKIARQDFAVILAKAVKLDSPKGPNESSFSDVSSFAFPNVENVDVDADAVAFAAASGLIDRGTTGTFDPKGREQVAEAVNALIKAQ